ncbi:MAG TPA: prolipoprotein diacylglyceryl transferase family protein, partial [Planctomycetota bacterium]|nr:prolipoprotein diacylglyceryl transferase family protein [Planctomycetota bacterium]
MWPILFKVGSLEVPSFGILALAGLFVAMLIQRREAARLGYDGKKVEELILVSVICAWIGAKGLYVLTTPGVALSSVMSAGYVFYGGVLAGVPAAWILARRAGIPGGRLVDIITPGMTLGLAIAR